MGNIVNWYKESSDDEIVFEAGRAMKTSAAPVEMQRRLKDSIDALNKSTAYYSRAIIWLTIAMLLLVFMQTIKLF